MKEENFLLDLKICLILFIDMQVQELSDIKNKIEKIAASFNERISKILQMDNLEKIHYGLKDACDEWNELSEFISQRVKSGIYFSADI